MTKTSRIFQTFGGVTLAFLVGVAAIAAQDKAPAHKADGDHQAAAKTEAAVATPAAHHAYAPGLPGWFKHLSADKQEAARKIWLVEGRVIHASKEMVTAKRHELDALLALPATDDKAVAAQVKEIASWEEKLLLAEISLRRKLEKEGIPTWGNFDHGKHNMMMGGGMKGMMGMMGGDHGKSGDADKPKDGQSGH